MENLGFQLLVDKSAKRKIVLLNELENGPKSLKSLAAICNSTERTVTATIAEINEELEGGAHIDQFGKNFFHLKIEDFFIIKNYSKDLMRESPLFIMIELIFEGNELTIEEYADILYVSDSTIRKYIAILSKVLAPYSLKLSLKPLDISGNETDIRFFFFQYFRYGHDTSTLIQKNKRNAESTYEFLDSLASNYGVVLHVDYYRLVTWLFIFEKRISLNKFVTLDPKIVNKHIVTESFHRFHHAFYSFYADNSILTSISKQEEVYAYVVRLSTIIYDSNGIFFLADYTNQLEEFNSTTNSFFSSYGLYPTLHMDLRVKIHCFLANLKFLTEITPLFQKSSSELIMNTTKHFSSIFSKWKSVLNNENQWSFPDDIAINLTVLSSIDLHLNLYKYKRVLFALTGEPTALTLYKILAYKLVPKEAEVHFFSNRPITQVLVDTLAIDILVCNFSIENLKNVDIIRLSEIPSKTEWENLLLKLYDI